MYTSLLSWPKATSASRRAVKRDVEVAFGHDKSDVYILHKKLLKKPKSRAESVVHLGMVEAQLRHFLAIVETTTGIED